MNFDIFLCLFWFIILYNNSSLTTTTTCLYLTDGGLSSDQLGLSLDHGGGLDGVGAKVGVGHWLGHGSNNWGGVVDKGSSVVDNGSSMVDKGSGVMEDGS